MQLKTLTIAVTGLLLLFPAAGHASNLSYVPRHGKTCKRGYVRRHRAERHRGHVRRIRVCVRRHHPQKTSSPPPPPAATVKLHAHLDPSFTRDELDPFKITYSYSASATQTRQTGTLATVEEPASLPSGVLALYADGKLQCAENVGSGVTGSECPVSYDQLGQHSVTTIYSSGEQSATETEVENIDPLYTTTTLSVNFTSQQPQLAREMGNGKLAWKVGTLRATAAASPTTVQPQIGCGGITDELCAHAFTVSPLNVYGITESTCEPIYGVDLGSYPPTLGEHRQALATDWQELPRSFARAYSGGGGYETSEATAVLDFGEPEATEGC